MATKQVIEHSERNELNYSIITSDLFSSRLMQNCYAYNGTFNKKNDLFQDDLEEKGGEQSDGEQRDLSLGSVIIAPIRA